MTDSFSLQDSASLADLTTFVGRAARVENGSVRLIAGGGVLAVYVAVLYPAGLLDETPTVLGLRTFVLPDKEEFDVVVPVASLQMRLERLGHALADAAPTDAASRVTVTLPMQVYTATWTAISPPRGGWAAHGTTSTALLDAVARAGIDEVAAAVPSGAGEQIVHRVRSEVWGRPIRGVEHVPAGAGFAALSLGFLPSDSDEQVPVYETGPWTRLSTKRGHVLVKRRAWSLAG